MKFVKLWDLLRYSKHDSRRHSITSFSENIVVAETIYQILEA